MESNIGSPINGIGNAVLSSMSARLTVQFILPPLVEPGYVPQIISPRDSGGKYTSDPNKTESYITMDKETHAKEIAISLQKEPIIPTSIIDYFVKTLGGVKNELITPPPTATTLTKTKEDEDTSRNLTSLTPNKYAAIVGALLVVIFGSLYLGSTK